MPLSDDEQRMFMDADDRITKYGTGDYSKQLPKALRNVEATYKELGELSSLHCLVLRASARRLDEIARIISPWGDTGTIQLAASLRRFTNHHSAVTA